MGNYYSPYIHSKGNGKILSASSEGFFQTTSHFTGHTSYSFTTSDAKVTPFQNKKFPWLVEKV